MTKRADPGTIPVSKLNARPSASADAARKLAIERILALSPRDRVLKALSLEALSLEALSLEASAKKAP